MNKNLYRTLIELVVRDIEENGTIVRPEESDAIVEFCKLHGSFWESDMYGDLSKILEKYIGDRNEKN